MVGGKEDWASAQKQTYVNELQGMGAGLFRAASICAGRHPSCVRARTRVHSHAVVGSEGFLQGQRARMPVMPVDWMGPGVPQM